ncbi:putative MFS family arabinose efflux permease [Motilibacter peucedani]|uniref:Putative MFS family arabinose efflux permease n=1 Tax=Motilibacter peucedani TaxID=598650 RepID=A0A420XKP5_9ACTN|nr:MFS transporter [Motilibacter peucedani]RKS68478.1 putative MFS family arabinose efflux permease [Motilibacter peucedani]
MSPAATATTADPTDTYDAATDTPTDVHPAEPATRRSAIRDALAQRNYRIYVMGQAVSNTGNWFQSIALDWLVLQLTHSSAAVGVTMALQFLPMLLFGMYGGVLADRYPRRRILIATQSTAGVLTACLAALTLTGRETVWEIWAIALLGGIVFMVDNPTRQAFLHDLVDSEHISSVVALNGAVFHSTRLVGPALAGVLIGALGCGWAFVINALCFLGPLVSLFTLSVGNTVRTAGASRGKGEIRAALRYVRRHRDIAATIALVGVVGTFGLNFPVVLTGMAQDVFHGNATYYGFFNVMLAVGSVTGALLSAGRPKTPLRGLALGAVGFGAAQALAALMPGVAVFAVVLVAMGGFNLAFQALANSSVQLSSDPALRGRVMSLYMLVFVGGTPIGAPIVGAVTAHEGARAGMLFCGAVPMLAALCLLGALAVRDGAGLRRACTA